MSGTIGDVICSVCELPCILDKCDKRKKAVDEILSIVKLQIDSCKTIDIYCDEQCPIKKEDCEKCDGAILRKELNSKITAIISGGSHED